VKVTIITIESPNQVERHFRSIVDSSFEIKIIQGSENVLDVSKFDVKNSKILYQTPLKKGEVNCSLAHKFIYDNHVKSNLEWAVVLEDDAILTEHFNKNVKLLSDHTFNFPAIIILGHSKTKYKNLWFQNLKQPPSSKIEISNIELVQKNCNFFGTVGYMINKQAAELISAYDAIFWKADHWSIFENLGIRIYHLSIPIVWENFENTNSSTGNVNQAHHDLFSKNFYKEFFSMLITQAKRIFN
jgi:GR25 family glycosyltransferase involved in LPS biosynthesis